MAKPAEFPQWATTDELDPITGAPNKVEPTPEFKLSGLKRREPLPRAYVNYQFDLISDWLEYFDANMAGGDAIDVTYDNTTSGLTATNVQAAIDEVDGNLDTVDTNLTELDTQFEGNRLASRPWAVSDAMYSWWARPMSMRYTDDDYNRTYQTFTQRNGAVGIIVHDHNLGTTERYLLDSDRVADDHNAGCVSVGDGKVVAVFGGRSNIPGVADNDECLICEWDITDTPNGNSFNKYYLNIGRDYPNLYQYEDDAFLLVSQRGANGFTTGHSYKLNSWPLNQAGWSVQRDLFSTTSSPNWTYVTSRRRVDNPNIIDIAVGFHPEFQSEANIYVGEIRHVGGTDPWRLFVNGSEIANLSTGANLPVVPSDLELAYTAGVGEKTRLFDCKDARFVFASYTGSDPSTAVYKYGYKDGTWQSSTIGNTGKPFYVSSSYWGGAAISENSNGRVTTAMSVGDYFRFKEYATDDGGATWFEIDEYVVSGQAGSAITHGRPLPENASLSTLTRGDNVNYVMTGWAGRYSTSDFTDYSTNILTIRPWNSNTAMMPWQANGQAIAAKPSSFENDLQASIASQGSSFKRERSADLGSSGVSAITRNTGAVGSRNVTFTGVVEASGLSDTWIMGSVGSNESTVGKNYSAVIGSDQVSIDVGDSNGVVGNVIAASGAGSSISSSSSYSINMAGLGNTLDADFSIIAGGDNNTISNTGAGYDAIIAGFNNTVSDSRGVVIGSRDSSVNNGAAAGGVYHSQDSASGAARSVVMASSGTTSATANTVVGGDGLTASTANRTWELNSSNGNLTLAGTLTENHNFADIAKMMKNGEGAEVGYGYLLTILGDSVVKAKEGEKIDAIVAATPSMVHNDTPFHWQGRYELDDFGKVVMEDAPFVKWEGYNGSIEDCPHTKADWPSDAEEYTKLIPIDAYRSEEVRCVFWHDYEGLKERWDSIPNIATEYVGKKKKENPNYNPDVDNTPRSERPDEWTCAGVHGIIRTRVDNTVTQQAVEDAKAQRENIFLEPSSVDGVGRLAPNQTNVQVMAVEKEYDPTKSYGVALCMLR